MCRARPASQSHQDVITLNSYRVTLEHDCVVFAASTSFEIKSPAVPRTSQDGAFDLPLMQWPFGMGALAICGNHFSLAKEQRNFMAIDFLKNGLAGPDGSKRSRTELASSGFFWLRSSCCFRQNTELLHHRDRIPDAAL